MNTDVSAKPVNDQIDVFMTATLPDNFAYIIRSFNIQLAGDTAEDWVRFCSLRMSNHIPGQPLGIAESILVELGLFAPQGTNFIQGRGDLGLNNFTTPMWSTHGANSISFRSRLANTAAAVGAAAFVTTHVEFYEYDLSQAQKYFLNTPLPIQIR